MSRRTSREFALQFIFSFGFNQEENVMELLKEFQESETAYFDSNDFRKEDEEFAQRIILSTISNLDKIDEIIKDCAVDWSFERISKVDLAILRMAISEIYFLSDIPEGVSANEAVEISKKFSSSDSSGFINGIIGKAIKDKHEKED